MGCLTADLVAMFLQHYYLLKKKQNQGEATNVHINTAEFTCTLEVGKHSKVRVTSSYLLAC